MYRMEPNSLESNGFVWRSKSFTLDVDGDKCISDVDYYPSMRETLLFSVKDWMLKHDIEPFTIKIFYGLDMDFKVRILTADVVWKEN